MVRCPSRDLSPLPPVGTTLIAGFESTYLPAYGVDSVDVTDHARLWRQDLDDVRTAGVGHLRYPLRWQEIEREPGRFDWTRTDEVLDTVRENGLVPIVDLVHHTSYPDWLQDGFRDDAFGPALERYAEAVAVRYPWLPAYTLFNEPFATLFLAGHEGLWPPYDRGLSGFVRLLSSVLPALSASARCWRELLPNAHHVWVDTAEHHAGHGAHAEYARLANDRRHVVLDLVIGHDLDPGSRPFLRQLVEEGGEHLLSLEALQVDVLGLDYYCHSEWLYDQAGAHAPSPEPIGFAQIAQQYGDRYDLPMMLSETNLRGLPTDQVTWLRYALEQYELAVERGLPMHGLCWFPQVDSADWDSLLARCAGRIDPVGVRARRQDGSRVHTDLTAAWEAVAAGATSGDLPAYRLQAPCDRQLASVVEGLEHWPWQSPAGAQLVPATVLAAPPAVQRKGAEPDLVVLSHLRWHWVWQRPQHLVARFAAARAGSGARTFFVEEPLVGAVTAPELHTQELDGVTRLWLVVPEQPGRAVKPGFDDDRAHTYGELLEAWLRDEDRPDAPDVWLYTPMAFDVAQRLGAGRLVYDVMDDLASFKDAPEGLLLRQRRLLTEADVVFAGGRSLHRGVSAVRRGEVHLFPSGVETQHYARSRRLRAPRERKVAGYVGVIDERLDVELLGELARGRPDWTIRVVGPVAKIDPATLPTEPNIEYPGQVAYEDLPEVMAGFDVALMPFALNEATRSISPTKTLEYLAAGLPVISTRVPDVVADYDGVVHLADDGAAFAAACLHVVQHRLSDRDLRVRPLQARQEWDAIAASMAELISAAPSRLAQEEHGRREASA